MDFLSNGAYEGICAFPFRLLISAASLVLSLAVDSSVSILFPWCWEIRSKENVLGVISACLI